MPDESLPDLPRRARGTGSITRSGNRFRASIRIAESDGTTKPRIKNFETYEQADAWLTSLISQQRRVLQATGNTGTAEADTVRDVLRLWIMSKYRDSQTHGKPDIHTVKDYDSLVREHIVPHIGDVKVAKIGVHHIEAWQDTLSETISKRTGKKLSPDRKRIIWVAARQAFKWSYLRGYLTSDPTAGIKGFKKKQVDVRRKAMSDADYKKFIRYLIANPCDHKNGYCRLRWLVGIQLGRRQGEVLAITWDDVNFRQKALRIDNRLKPRNWKHGCEPDAKGQPSCGRKEGVWCTQRHGGGLVLLEGTKGGESVRPLIPIEGLVKYFREHQVAQAAERKAFAAAEEAKRKRLGLPVVEVDEDKDAKAPDFVFTQPDTQKPYGATSDNLRFKWALEAAGITTHYHVHQLRHTLASRLAVSTNGNLPVLKDVLGHRSIQTSMLYISEDMKARQKALSQTWSDAMQDLAEVEEAESEEHEDLTKEA